MFDLSGLEKSLAGIGVRPGREIFVELDACYGHESRHYHDRSHVSECLRQFENFHGLADRVHEIEVAIWFHDAIYDTRRQDNEEKSAELATVCLALQGAQVDIVERIARMIIATKTHVTEGGDAALLVDIDLGILGTPKPRFEQYDAAIRREYDWVPEETYRQGRREVLEGFLQRDRIYQTDVIGDLYEAAARKNLQRKISELSG